MLNYTRVGPLAGNSYLENINPTKCQLKMVSARKKIIIINFLSHKLMTSEKLYEIKVTNRTQSARTALRIMRSFVSIRNV